MQKKTTLTEKDVATFLRERFAYEIKSVLSMVEGEESQAFSFEWGGTGYVIRINKSIAGFQKDAYAYTYDNILYQNWEMAQWAAKRCADIASISPPHTSSPS